MHAVRIEGQQVVLRDWQLADLGPYGFWMQPGQRWQELDGPYYGSLSASAIQALLERQRAAILAGEWPDPRARVVVADRERDALVGTVSWYWIGQETSWLAAGIALYDPAQWGKGRGYEALGLWCEYLWERMPQIVRLDLRTWSGNHRMMALAHKLGFVEEARFRKARIVDGVYYDGMGYGILREEWRARYPDGFAQHLHSG